VNNTTSPAGDCGTLLFRSKTKGQIFSRLPHSNASKILFICGRRV